MSRPLEHSPLQILFLPPRAWAKEPDSSLDETGVSDTLFQRLRRMNIVCRIINPVSWPWNPFAGKNPFIQGLDLCRAVKILLFSREVDAVVSVFESGGLFLLLFRRLFAFKPRILLWDASVGNKWRVLRIIQRVVFPRYDGFMMLTSSQKKYLEEQARVRGPVHLIYYNVDEIFFHPHHNAKEEYILTVGDDISRDYPTMWSAVSDIGHRVVFKTNWRPANFVPESHRNIEFVSSRLGNIEYRKLLAAATLVVVPLFQVESAGGITALFEAMAMGKPIVVSESSLTADFVIPNENALIVPSRNVVAMKTAIDELLSDAKLRERIGRNARMTIENRFSSPALAERIASCIVDHCRCG